MNHRNPHVIKNVIYIIILLFVVSKTLQGAGDINNSNSGNSSGENAEVAKAHQLLEKITEADRFINKLEEACTIDLPVGLVARDKMDAQKYAIIISTLKVVDGKSYITAYMPFTIPGTGKKIAFKGTDIPFSFNGGVQPPVVLELVSDVTVNISNQMKLILNGNGKTTVSWDCFGFKQMNIDADILFDSTLFIPENPDGTLKNEMLRTHFQTSITDWNNLMVGISLEPFQLKGLKGVGFNITNAVFDMSDFKNPPNLMLPPGYTDNGTFLNDSFTTWRGVYIQEAQVRMPPEFKKKSNATSQPSAAFDTNTATHQSAPSQRVTFYTQNLFVDDLGFTADIGIQNLLTLQEGDMRGWGFSITDLHLNIMKSQLTGGGFSGQIHVPQFEQNSLFNYSASMGMNSSYNFTVGITDSLSMNMWAANLRIDPNSYIDIQLIENEFYPSLMLNGTLSVNAPVDKDDPSSKKLSVASVPFQGMKIQTIEPYFEVDYVSFGTEQNIFSGFPVSITDIAFISDSPKVGLQIGLNVNFVKGSDGGFAGNGRFTVWAERYQKKWYYDGVEVSGIAVNIDKGENFRIHGEVMFVRGDEVYGNGFRGDLRAKFAKIGLDAVALFGSINGYRYWFADAMATIPGGVATGPVSFYGFGGGAYYHMRQGSIPATPLTGIGKSLSGINYIPDKTTNLGLKASVKFGLAAKKEAFNGDVEFGIGFTRSGGIGQLSLVGNGYFMTKSFNLSQDAIMGNAEGMVGNNGNNEGQPNIPLDAENAEIYANVSMLMDFTNDVFHANFNVYANIAGGLIKGVGPGGKAGWGVIHFEPGEWYIHLGTPEDPNGIDVAGLAQLTNYFMAGHNIPELPPPPSQVLSALNMKAEDFTQGIQNSGLLSSGKGIALGAEFSFDTGERTFLIFYGRIGGGLGFDLLLKDYSGYSCKGRSGIGINNWFAQGQAYAWVGATVGIKVSLPFYKGKYEILDMQAGVLLQAKGPNPFWMRGDVGGRYSILNGLVKGHCKFTFEVGEKCQLQGTGDPLKDIKAITDITPADGMEEVDIYTSPQVVFNIPVNESFEVETLDGSKKTFKTSLEHFTVTNSTGLKIDGIVEWNDDKTTLAYKPDEWLTWDSDITVDVKIKFLEYKNGKWEDVKVNGEVSVEQKQTTFKTIPMPDYIPQYNIVYTYPQNKAFNFYQDIERNGVIKLFRAQDELFNTGNDIQQIVRLVNLSNGNTHRTSLSYANKQISFVMPNLDNGSVYRLELVNVPLNSKQAIDYNVKQESTVSTYSDESSDESTDIEINTQYAEGVRKEAKERVFYEMVFRNSQYNTLQEKINQLSMSDGVRWEISPRVHSITVNIRGERFDKYELADSGAIRCSVIADQTPWYLNEFKPYLESLPDDIINSIEPYQVPDECAYLFEMGGERNLTDNEIELGMALDDQTLSGMKNYIARYSEQYFDELRVIASNLATTAFYTDEEKKVVRDLLTKPFKPITNGTYPVKLKYYIPGNDTPVSEFIYQIKL